MKKIKKDVFKSKYILISVVFGIAATIIASLAIFFVRISAKEKITVIEFSIPTFEASPVGITSGPDGNLWFTEQGHNSNKIGRITPNGDVTEFPIPTNDSGPFGITLGPDDNLWFTETYANKIGKITPNGVISEFSIPTPNSEPMTITAGSDSNLWFTESGSGKIGRITPSGSITEFSLPSSISYPFSITLGSDTNLWFTELNNNKIGRITISGDITEFPVTIENSTPLIITTGYGSSLWFTDPGVNKIGQITLNGDITEFPIPTSNSYPYGITKDADGNLWFTEQDPNANKVSKIDTKGKVTEFAVPTAESNPTFIVLGSDGNLWFTENNVHKIGQVNLSNQHGPPESDFSLLSPFNNGVAWTVTSGYFNNRDQTSTGCHVGIGPDHCRNQLFGLDMVPNLQSDTQILAPGDGNVSFRGKLEGGCVGLRITLDNGLNLNVCHFATWNVEVGDRVLRGKILGTRSTSHVHLSLDNRHTTGNLCPGQEKCYLPVPFDGKYNLDGLLFPPDPNGETVTLPYPKCDKKNVNCEFKVGFEQYEGFTGTSTNIALP